jgi:hypothetical protein
MISQSEVISLYVKRIQGSISFHPCLLIHLLLCFLPSIAAVPELPKLKGRKSNTMGKKKVAASSSATASAAGLKATGAAPKSTTTAIDPQCDWAASTITKRDEKKMRSLGLISSDAVDIQFPGPHSHPNPPTEFVVIFLCSSPQISSLSLVLLRHTALASDAKFHPSSCDFITICEAFLGIDPHWGL